MTKPNVTSPVAERVKYYLDRAEEARALAAMMKDDTARRSLIQQSETWKSMAEGAGKRDDKNR
ncbi:MAG: hypothetical protein AB7E79_13640 [Rhodospirillaceae bacterium]